MRKWSVVQDGEVIDGFDAEQEFVDGLLERLDVAEGETPADPPVWWTPGVQLFDVTDQEVRPTRGFTLTRTGWVPPVEPEPTPPSEQELARQADREFVEQMQAKVRDGGSLTQDERDRLQLIELARGT